MQRQIVGQIGSEDEGRAFGLKAEPGFLRALNLRGTCRAQCGGFRGPDGRERDNDDRFGIAERRRDVQTKVQRVLRRERQRGNVLKVRRVERRQNLGGVDDCADIGAELPGAAHRGVTQLVHQVAGGAVGDLRHQRLRIGIVEHHAVGVLGQARGLLVCGLIKTLLIDFDAQGARRKLRPFLQLLLVGLAGNLHIGQVGIQPHAVPTGGLQVLGGAHKSTGAVVDGLAQGAEIAAGFGRQEDDGLLRFLRNGNEDALFAGDAGPRLNARKPIKRRGIGGSAQEGYDEDEVGRLALRQVRMDPKAVSGQKVGGLADGQGNVAPLDVYVYLGTGKVESRTIGMHQSGDTQRHRKQQQRQTTAHITIVRSQTIEANAIPAVCLDAKCAFFGNTVNHRGKESRRQSPHRGMFRVFDPQRGRGRPPRIADIRAGPKKRLVVPIPILRIVGRSEGERREVEPHPAAAPLHVPPERRARPRPARRAAGGSRCNAGARSNRAFQPFEQVLDVERGDANHGLSGFDLGDVERVVDQGREPLGGLADELNLFLLLARQLAVAAPARSRSGS